MNERRELKDAELEAVGGWLLGCGRSDWRGYNRWRRGGLRGGPPGRFSLDRASADRATSFRRCERVTVEPFGNVYEGMLRDLRILHLPPGAPRPVLPGAVERVIVQTRDDLLNLAGA